MVFTGNMSVTRLQVNLDMRGESISVYYSQEDTMINSTVIPALNCYKHVRHSVYVEIPDIL